MKIKVLLGSMFNIVYSFIIKLSLCPWQNFLEGGKKQYQQELTQIRYIDI